MRVTEQTREARRKQTAEVFTPRELIDEMLDKLPEDVWESVDKTFLDNSCGNGNFLVAILERKLSLGMDPEASLRSIYGVELMADNVEECKQRLLALVPDVANARAIVDKNIICHDALTYDYNFGEKPKFEFGFSQ